MSKEDMIKEAVEEAKAEAAKMEDEAAADEQDEAAETKGSVEEEASKETEESQDTKDTESKFFRLSIILNVVLQPCRRKVRKILL